MSTEHLLFDRPWRSLVLGLSTSALAGALVLGSVAVGAAEIESSIARGGRLYDKWFKVVDAETPKVAHPSYPDGGKYKGKKGADWRCKECHGWDYMGKDGAYRKGKHSTGIMGIRAYDGDDPDRVVRILTNGTHGYTKEMMDESDLMDLARFVVYGQIEVDQYIDRASKKVKGGNPAKGEAYYNTVCANCHGKDGKAIEDGEAIGDEANSNPWEVLHKIRNGQPDEQMPAWRAFDVQLSLDILAYTQTLPQ